MPNGGRSIEVIRAELDDRIRQKLINGYLILPSDVLNGERPQFFGSNTVDLFTRRLLQQAVNRAIRDRRLEELNIDANTIEELSQPAQLQTVRIGASGEERDSGEGFLLVFVVGFVMYLTILLYGQVVLGAIIEEKETRIAEILFSSVRPFTLMMGKLVGVSLVALTQLAIWAIGFVGLSVVGVNMLASRGIPLHHSQCAAPSLSILRSLFPTGILYLLNHLRLRWIDGNHAAGRWPTRNANNSIVGDRLLPVLAS